MSSEAKTDRLQIVIEPALKARIDDYRFGNRISSQGRAVRELIEKGLEASVSAKASEASAGQQA